MGNIKERVELLQPARMEWAVKKISDLGFYVEQVNEAQLRFMHKGHIVNFWPYTGWASGKTIKDGRGLSKLLKQLK